MAAGAVALPEGFILEQSTQAGPPGLPEGFVLEQPKQFTAAQTAWDVAKQIPTSLAEGVVAMPGAVPQLLEGAGNLINKGLRATGMMTPEMEQAELQRRNLEADPGTKASFAERFQGGAPPVPTIDKYLPQPETPQGQFTNTLGRFVAPSMALKGSNAANLVAGMGAGTGAYVGEQAFPDNPTAQALMAAGGAILPGGASRIISPGTINEARAPAVQALKDAGVKMPASVQTGSKALGFIEKETGDAIGAGSKYTAARDRMMDTYTQAAANKIPEFSGTKALTPEAMNEGIDKIGDQFKSVAGRNQEIKLDREFMADFERLKVEQEGMTGIKPVLLDSYMARLQRAGGEGKEAGPPPSVMSAQSYREMVGGGAPPGMHLSREEGRKLFQSGAQKKPMAPPIISGEAYQKVSSDLGRAIRAAPENMALRDFKEILDDAIGRNLKNPKDKDVWQQARKSYKNAMVLDKAMKTSTEDAALGRLTPAKLTQGINQVQSRGGYTRGRSTFEPLARAGNTVMKDLPDSGTAARVNARVAMASIPAAGASLFAGHPHIAAAALAAPWMPGIAGRAIMSRPGQAFLSNQVASPLRHGSLLNALAKGSVLGSIPLRGR